MSRTHLFLYLTTFFTGASVLIIEVAAVRMLAPYYGSSLPVFSSVLTTILGALSLGYFVGGILADKYPYQHTLYALIGASGLTTVLALFLGIHVVPWIAPFFSIFSGPLLFSVLLFFAPAALLGVVSPYLIKLLAYDRTHEEMGRISGTVFFVGTIGSISGSLLSGFLLVPLLGIKLTLLSVGTLLAVLGTFGMLLSLYGLSGETLSYIRRGSIFFVCILILATSVLAFLSRGDGPSTTPGLLYRGDGRYGYIGVYEGVLRGEPVRALRRDTNNESAIYLNSYDSVFAYMQIAERFGLLTPHAAHILMLGGGAYSLPRTVLARDPNVKVDVVEIEPSLYALAQSYFDVPTSTRLVNHVGDARVFLLHTPDMYDFIFQDTFGTDLTIPAHLGTREFYELVRSRVRDEGIVMVNFIGTLTGSPPTLTGSLIRTITSVFPVHGVYALRPETPDRIQNILFVLRNGTEPISFGDTKITLDDGEVRSIESFRLDPRTYASQDHVIFTDDKAPIEYLLVKGRE